MTEMIERVARRLSSLHSIAFTAVDDEGDGWRSFIGDARELIADMREPSDQMVEAGLDCGPDRDPVVYWAAMIAAALAEGE